MLKPQQHRHLLLRDPPPPLPGKPWLWPRGGAMQSAGVLARLVLELRDEIEKLEAENRVLRGGGGGGDPRPGGESSGAGNPGGSLRRNASAPLLDAPRQENTAVMTVRRYSTSSNLSRTATREVAPGRDSGWTRLQQEVRHGSAVFGNSSSSSLKGEVGKVTNRHSLQEYVHKTRAKVKTVTFLLPVDDIYTNRPVLANSAKEEARIPELASRNNTR